MIRIALVPPCKASLMSQMLFLVMRDAVRDLVIIRRVTRLVVREIPSSKPRPRTVATRQFKFLNSYFPDTLTVRGNTGWASFARIWLIRFHEFSHKRVVLRFHSHMVQSRIVTIVSQVKQRAVDKSRRGCPAFQDCWKPSRIHPLPGNKVPNPIQFLCLIEIQLWRRLKLRESLRYGNMSGCTSMCFPFAPNFPGRCLGTVHQLIHDLLRKKIHVSKDVKRIMQGKHRG